MKLLNLFVAVFLILALALVAGPLTVIIVRHESTSLAGKIIGNIFLLTLILATFFQWRHVLRLYGKNQQN